jgi:hypothetical protein
MPWLTMHQDLLEYVLSQIILEASTKAEINRWWLEEPLVAGKRASRHWRR